MVLCRNVHHPSVLHAASMHYRKLQSVDNGVGSHQSFTSAIANLPSRSRSTVDNVVLPAGEVHAAMRPTPNTIEQQLA